MTTTGNTGGPLTAAMLAAVQRVANRERRIIRVWTVVFAALTVAFVLLFAVTQNSASILFSAICAGFLLLLLIAGQFALRATQRRLLDIAYERYTGPLRVDIVQTQRAGGAVTQHRLIVGTLPINLEPHVASELAEVTSGSVVYVPFTYGRNLLLEVLDEKGGVLHRRAGYSAE